MIDFQTDNLKLAAINLKDKPEQLSGLIKDKIATVDHYFNGILNTDVLSALVSISYELEEEGHTPEVIENFNDKLWGCIHSEPLIGFQYSLILRKAFESYELARTVTLSTFTHYFKHIDMNEWINEWHEESVKALADRNMIELTEGRYFSLDQSDLSYGFIRYINDDCRRYFFENANTESASIYIVELCRRIFAKQGCVPSSNLLKSLLIERPDTIKSANSAVDAFVDQMEYKFENHDFFYDDFASCAISYIKTKPHTLRHAIKSVRVATGNQDDLVKFLNKTRSNVSNLMDFMCAVLRITPFELLHHKGINDRGKSHCMKSIAS